MTRKNNGIRNTLSLGGQRLGNGTSAPAKKVGKILRNEEKTLNRRTTVYFSEETWERLKIATVQDRIPLSHLLEQEMKRYLARRDRKKNV